ncbi:PREDICTED: putative aminoacrylate hydrolase RutD [Theobroma cacao]|uniref:Aminoacrylate hydrolase RutD n=1 Tax=Theobroma cacao TaxID=3641 RepID=A0AB32VQG2_THECC|nr:PREDICTED: putative aminoacrylate hydrolase RutD [Theobroma cacao]XP_017970051.1 PREDICTED: putative aminoacrylate hydrolase RutD [Theobroma cacao]XP_017970052.1 PREDICTED: putative aminoacrylate hydrolase RutD [Theobroma cacao]XP_017970053.1 PREDICTED: putative aminoacrylate hydrolase RutD [Theobroma cacao]XP_017970054.1 PREDICTED: putative aminoacrylate hydrolase RutD [Theobroma cacao]XP_017970055.1 PREDICTED: putative aminoacrylate hydrolase RutD [Theobroma cacao]
MVNFVKIYNKPLLPWLMKLAGVRPRTIEIEPGTVLNFWVPNETATKRERYKPVVVFLHGFCANGILTWQFQVLALAKHYAVYVPDLLFFGDSITDKTERSVEFQAECMAKGLKKLGVERCTLVGFSYGGFVGFKMAEMHPDLIEAMVLIGSVIAMTDSISNAGLQRIGFSSWPDYLLPDSAKGLRMLFQLATYKLPRIPHRIYKDFLEVMFNNRKEKIELLEALVIGDKEFIIPSYQQRIHILWGKDDKLIDLDAARNMKKQIGENATLHCMEKSGHLAHMERPFMCNRFLKKILASLLLEDNAADHDECMGVNDK